MTPRLIPQMESNVTERIFHGLRSRNTVRSTLVPMAVTDSRAVAAIALPHAANTVETTTQSATPHSNAGLPSWLSETNG
ncbi:hypothetical protein BanimalisJ1_03380 [Bifidobacterium animalis]|nr:hypothetical protein BanimalisJ1_03380 [Bifidobacterium animalis]GEA00458.1 hypothetical protein BanimalisJ3_09160 [Bifidobacterium animalis]